MARDPEAAASAGRLIDIDLPETFHRYKRTVLLLASALTVLGLSTAVPDAGPDIALGLIKVSLSRVLAEWLLWVAMVYYLVGFALEVRVAQRLNAPILRDQAGAKKYDERLGELSELINRSKDAFEALPKHYDRLMNSADSFDQLLVTPQPEFTDEEAIHLDKLSKPLTGMMLSSRETSRNAAREKILGKWGPVRDLAETVRKGVADHAEAIKYIAVRLEGAERALVSNRREFTALSRSITGERRVQFWLWELSGALGAAAIASLIGLSAVREGLINFWVARPGWLPLLLAVS